MSVWIGSNVAKCVTGRCKVNATSVDLTPSLIERFPDTKITKVAQVQIIDDKRLIFGSFTEMKPSKDKCYHLPAGTYRLHFSKVSIPLNATGFLFPRSTFLRLGILMFPTAVWDSGYSGEGVATFYFFKPAMVHKDVAWAQLVFIDNKSMSRMGYSGIYQGETAKGARKK
jgi:deoxycytidine triphosphate deaminase